MALFYRGAGIGTYWHTSDARLSGFTPKSPGTISNTDRLMRHVARGAVNSPYISLTKSYDVAVMYARDASRTMSLTSSNPAYVYEIEINDPLPGGLQLLDPLVEIASSVSSPLSSNYHNEGTPYFLLGVVAPLQMGHFLKMPVSYPPGSGGTSRPPNLSLELEALARALRDAEILAVGNIPKAYVTDRFNVW